MPNQSINIVYPKEKNMIVKEKEIITSIQVCLISWINISDKENAGKKSLFANSKHQYHVSHYREHDCSAKNKKNGHYNKYLCLPHFTNELYLYGKWWKEKLFLPNQSINIVYPIEVNMIVVPITKSIEIIVRIQV